MDCSKNNIASAKTMLHFDAQLEKEYLDDGEIIQDYIIDVNQAILKHKDEFVNLIANDLLIKNIKLLTFNKLTCQQPAWRGQRFFRAAGNTQTGR